MIEPWVYAALTAVAMLTGFIDAIAGGGNAYRAGCAFALDAAARSR